MKIERDIYIKICPYCGGNELYSGFYSTEGVIASSPLALGSICHHSICRSCGSIVQSYIDNPEKMLKKIEQE